MTLIAGFPRRYIPIHTDLIYAVRSVGEPEVLQRQEYNRVREKGFAVFFGQKGL